MKRLELIRHLLKNGCVFLREGSYHSIFFNPLLRLTTAVPRHKEIDDYLANKICKDVGVRPIKNS